jgi:hypothetical protein
MSIVGAPDLADVILIRTVGTSLSVAIAQTIDYTSMRNCLSPIFPALST